MPAGGLFVEEGFVEPGFIADLRLPTYGPFTVEVEPAGGEPYSVQVLTLEADAEELS